MRTALETHWRSRVALGFALVHAIVFLAIIFAETPLPPPGDEPAAPCEGCLDIWNPDSGTIVAGRFFHQQIGFDLLMTADLPALLVGAGFTLPLTLAGVNFSSLTESYLVAWIWFLLGTCQWWLCGMLAAAAWDPRAA